jgi:hypothetical protein
MTRKTHHKHFKFSDRADIPKFPLKILGGRMSQDALAVDVTDFSEQCIDRWIFEYPELPFTIQELTARVPECVFPVSPGFTHHCFKSPHVGQRANGPRIVINFLNGFQIIVIDTEKLTVHDLPGNYLVQEYSYASTGDFSRDGHFFYTARWRFDDAVSIMAGERSSIPCQVIRINMDTLEFSVIADLEYVNDIHQITVAGGGEYLVFSTFSTNPRIPYPRGPFSEHLEGFRASHESGLPLSDMMTLHIASGKYWKTRISTPRPAHFEVDPQDDSILYVSSHNMAYSTAGLILEGPADLYKLRVSRGMTEIVQEYADLGTFRMTQHNPFVHKGKTLIAVTNFPNRLDIIEGESMERIRSIKLFECPPLDFSVTGNAKCPSYPDMSLNVSPSDCGEYIVLQTTRDYQIYDMNADRLLDVKAPIFLEDGLTSVGHSRNDGPAGRKL